MAQSYPTTRPPKRRRQWLDEEARAGLVFASPFIIGFIIFTAGPLLTSLYFSFTRYDVINPPIWQGLENYRHMLEDPRFSKTLYNSVYFTLLYVPTALPFALCLAMLLNTDLRGLPIWRTAFYLPEITPVVAVGVLWLRILSPQDGLLNNALATIGIVGPPWTVDAQWVKPAIIIMRLWSVGWIVIVYLAALKQVPRTLHEAALVDGANAWRRFWHITLPMISNVIFFTVIMLTIFSLNIFTEPMVMFPPEVFGGQMGPQDSALFYVLYLFDQAFRHFSMGYASALGWILLLITIVIVIIQTYASRRLVYSETSDD